MIDEDVIKRVLSALDKNKPFVSDYMIGFYDALHMCLNDSEVP